MNIVLLRIGIDTGSGGIHGPLFQDSAFEYIPIPDGHQIDERTYGTLEGRHGRNLIDYFPVARREKMFDQSIHVDPEFESFTYGDPTSPKAGLRKLKPGDLLVFYCGLQGWDHDSAPALYLMGYFEVEWAGRATDLAKSELKELFSHNAHVRHRRVFERQRSDLVLVKGNANSQLLDKAVRISSDGTNRAGQRLKVLSPEMQKVFGNFGGKISIQRSPPRRVEPAFVAKAADFVRSLGCKSYEPVPGIGRAFSYVVTHDTGFAPNPFWGFCTLANCKPQIRRTAKPGDWVFGLGSPRNVGNGKLVYAMRVDEVLTFEEYDADPRFACKKPNLCGDPREQCGDNIYFKNRRGGWKQRRSFHGPDAMKTDSGGKNVLVGSHYFYFGENAVTIPARFRALVHKGRGHRCNFPPGTVERFIEWLHDNQEPGMHGEPSNRRDAASGKPTSRPGVGGEQVSEEAGGRSRRTTPKCSR